MPDNFGPVLIIVDAATNYIDAIPCKTRETSTVKRCLARVFGFFGSPLTIVSDNAPEFISLKFWLTNMGVKLVHTPPYNPASNGQAERAVQTIKKALKTFEDKFGDKFIYLQKILLNHRTYSGRTSPAERLLQYKPRTTVNANYSLGQEMIFKNHQRKTTTEVKYVVQAGQNTAWVEDDKHTWLASLSQLEPILSKEQGRQFALQNARPRRNRKPPKKLTYVRRGICGET